MHIDFLKYFNCNHIYITYFIYTIIEGFFFACREDVLKPVVCSICDRRFKNIPALNGHMRLHGGYFKKVRTLFDYALSDKVNYFFIQLFISHQIL